jgi:uncharacterized protein (DUF302 family)
MYYKVKTYKDFTTATSDLEKCVVDGGFGVLHIHNIGETLRSKGVEFAENCNVLEVCNPKIAAQVMAQDMQLNMALPCRISVYTQEGETLIGMIKPAKMLSSLSDSDELVAIAKYVEQTLIKMIDNAK